MENRFSSETLKLKIEIKDLDGVQRSVNDGANRRSFSTVVGALIIGAASILGVWLLVKIIRSDNSI